mgnify:CR=1 FL=1
MLAVPDLGRESRRGAEARLEEAAGLAEAIGIKVEEGLHFRVRQPRPATLFGQGQVEQIADAVRQAEAELVIVDSAITPVQQKNLEDRTKAKVIDRTGLILEIFGERAATAEGRLQVELAHLDYQAGRLVRSWTHLERQRGGFGFLGGPGETQIEADRRLIRDRMAKLRRELDQVARTRGLHRARRRRAPWPVIALVGYTNAGKSTLFNRLTRAEVLAEDLLFATLDPTMREISLPGLDKAILSDTVGFISDLPTQLVAAFRATLEEVISADLIVHVRDISHPDTLKHARVDEAELVISTVPDELLRGTTNAELVKQCKLGWSQRFSKPVFAHQPTIAELQAAYLPRLQFELDTLKRLGFAQYFLLVQDLVRWSKDNGIYVGPGRGSVGDDHARGPPKSRLRVPSPGAALLHPASAPQLGHRLPRRRTVQ